MMISIPVFMSYAEMTQKRSNGARLEALRSPNANDLGRRRLVRQARRDV